ncbi:MAG: ABC transporter permease subunit [Bdellovibrionales bacterium]|nr:ABC transporter permease subunit [Bdellovibrionales bacterium]
MLYKAACLLFTLIFIPFSLKAEPIHIGSKKFTENFILAEIAAQFLEEHGFEVKRRFGFGGTLIAFDALRTGEIDIYPEYTGTIARAIFKERDSSLPFLKRKLQPLQMDLTKPLGFNNTYALVVTRDRQQKMGLATISDLAKHPELEGALSFEFQNREDGWPQLKQIYGLKNKLRGVEIPLTYEALKNDKVDFAEVYSTDSLIKKYDFVILEDDKNFFPKYHGAYLVDSSLPEVKALLDQLGGTLNDQEMMDLNDRATRGGESFAKIAHDFLVNKKLKEDQGFSEFGGFNWQALWRRTREHLQLTLLAVLLATCLALPLSVFILGSKKLASWVLGLAGILQTIPSIALLTFMIPLFGIGFLPALIGLLIYSMLPILRNAYTALMTIDPRLILSARGIGLYPWEIFFKVKLPLSFPMILAGIRTATILNIGTATLAAFIGAGGLGEPIVTGLALNDTTMILQGALPAALLAILVDLGFAGVERYFSRSL